MATINGIPFNGGMDSPSGTGAQHIVQTCQAICSWLIDGTTPGQLLDGYPGGTIALQWVDRQLLDETATVSIDWQNRQWLDSMAVVAIDIEARQLYDLDGNAALDYTNRFLLTNGGNYSIDWQNQVLINDGTQSLFSWLNGISFFGVDPVAQQAGGGLTAGPLYTATEENMLNAIWAALQAYGLLT